MPAVTAVCSEGRCVRWESSPPADHQNARTIASILAASDAIEIDPESVQTNIVIFRLAPGAADPQTVVDRAREAGVGVFAFGDGIRAVTHRDVTADECREAASVLVAAAEAGAGRDES